MPTYRLRVDVIEIWDISIDAETESDAMEIALMKTPEEIRQTADLLATDVGTADTLDESYADEIRKGLSYPDGEKPPLPNCSSRPPNR